MTGRELQQKVKAEAERLGLDCDFERRSKHIRAVLRRGSRQEFLSLSGTPSDHMALQASISRVRRIARELTTA